MLRYSPGAARKLTLPGVKLYRSFHKVIPSGQSFDMPLTNVQLYSMFSPLNPGLMILSYLAGYFLNSVRFETITNQTHGVNGDSNPEGVTDPAPRVLKEYTKKDSLPY